MPIKKLGECTKCFVWGYAPNNFNETKHFMVCPICNGNMYLNLVNDEADFFHDLFPDKRKTEISSLRKAK